MARDFWYLTDEQQEELFNNPHMFNYVEGFLQFIGCNILSLHFVDEKLEPCPACNSNKFKRVLKYAPEIRNSGECEDIRLNFSTQGSGVQQLMGVLPILYKAVFLKENTSIHCIDNHLAAPWCWKLLHKVFLDLKNNSETAGRLRFTLCSNERLIQTLNRMYGIGVVDYYQETPEVIWKIYGVLK